MPDNKMYLRAGPCDCARCAKLAVIEKEADQLELALDACNTCKLIFKSLAAHVQAEHPKVAGEGTG